MVRKVVAALLVTVAGSAGAQAVTSFSGGTQFGAWDASSPGVVGWRFDVNTPIILTDIGIFNGDADGLTSNHEVGLWDSAGNLLTQGVTGPGGDVLGQFTYSSVEDVVLSPGERYTIGAVYDINDGDSYVSGPSVLNLAAEINPTTNGVFPEAGDLGGLFFPTGDSTNLARLGTNFLFRPVPAPASMALLGLGGVAACRRRR
ncbi:MAG: hypothetical protein Phyf2KO_21910 [Phycisphaerales bacterium]